MANEKLILDERCEKLLEEIQQHFEVHFTPWEESFCAFQVQERDDKGIARACNIYYYEGCFPAEIYHELLHAKCEYIFGCDKSLLFDVTDSNIKQIILDFRFWQSLSNQVQHMIMYPEFLKNGYKPDEFFKNQASVKSKEIRQFCAKGLKDKGSVNYNPVQLKCYINVLQHLLFYPCGQKFKRELELFEKLDKELFSIHKHLFEAIDGVEIDSSSAQRVHQAKHQYKEEMSKWFDKNKVRFPNINELNIMGQLITD